MKKNINNILLLTALIIGSFGTVFGVEMVTPKLNPPMPLPEFPIIDGSSSTITMHAAIKAYLTDEHILPMHSKTYVSLSRLLQTADGNLVESYGNDYYIDSTVSLWWLAPKREHIIIIDDKVYLRIDPFSSGPEQLKRAITLPGDVLAVPTTQFSVEDATAYLSTPHTVANVLLSVKYYDSALEEAEKYGADLVITPIAKEGFVFIVHEDNPVSSLTSAQIKDIFSGKITNWKQVGGNDERIINFQRNADSGSQTAMVDFMDGVPLENIPAPYIIASMSGMIEKIISEESAIGYNIYSWSLREITEVQARFSSEIPYFIKDTKKKNVKFIAIDGVAPSDETLSDGTYPLCVYTYSYYNKGDEKAKAFTDWLLTEEGQKVIASGGYVGIFGEMPPEEIADFDKDSVNIRTTIGNFYKEKGGIGHIRARIFDSEIIKEFADDKARFFTVLCPIDYYDFTTTKRESRFIVLTREKSGEFEVINEGLATYKNRVLTSIIEVAEKEKEQ